VTQLNYVLDIANAGQLLDRLGFANVVRGGRGRLDGDVKWNGLPYAMDIPSMSGKVQLDLAAGQFLKVDPGAAKLLGVLSMQSLPRRLTLDFRDIFSEGFAFDAITGSAQILQGVARTDNLKMRGVNATVVMAGNADIVNESQQLHVVVIPVINAGAASVVYGLAVNPVIGLGTFLAQLFLREPLAKAFTFEYMVSGPWKDPLVKKLNVRKIRTLQVSIACKIPRKVNDESCSYTDGFFQCFGRQYGNSKTPVDRSGRRGCRIIVVTGILAFNGFAGYRQTGDRRTGRSRHYAGIFSGDGAFVEGLDHRRHNSVAVG
jgi:hypothetical protein